ncbi:MAG: hypothetical protein IKQ49_00120 [Eubacterium sp.]|nr:hypothetical protein [Eubacterium sp.]
MSKLYPKYDPVQKKWYRELEGRNGVKIKDYAPTLITTMGPIPQGEKVVVQRLEDDREQVEPEKICPIRASIYGAKCSQDCSWWTGSECILTRPEAPQNDFTGIKGRCPILNRECLKTCAMRAGNKCRLVCKGDQK